MDKCIDLQDVSKRTSRQHELDFCEWKMLGNTYMLLPIRNDTCIEANVCGVAVGRNGVVASYRWMRLRPLAPPRQKVVKISLTLTLTLFLFIL